MDTLLKDIEIVADFVERYNKQDKEVDVAQAMERISEFANNYTLNFKDCCDAQIFGKECHTIDCVGKQDFWNDKLSIAENNN